MPAAVWCAPAVCGAPPAAHLAAFQHEPSRQALLVHTGPRPQAAVEPVGVLQSPPQPQDTERLGGKEGAVLVGHHLATDAGLLQARDTQAALVE